MIQKSGNSFTVTAKLHIKAKAEEIWSCFVDPKKSAEFFFGISFVSDLKVGSPITWSGEWQGKPFEDRGVVLDNRPPRFFRYDYFAASSGQPDTPENHNVVSYAFDPEAGGTWATIVQTNALTEESAQHSEKNWTTMLEAVRDKLERH